MPWKNYTLLPPTFEPNTDAANESVNMNVNMKSRAYKLSIYVYQMHPVDDKSTKTMELGNQMPDMLVLLLGVSSLSLIISPCPNNSSSDSNKSIAS